LFPLGQVVSTPAALRLLKLQNSTPQELLELHRRGIWGTIPEADAWANEEALKNKARVLSSYPMTSVERVWVITEADRSATTLLLPEEY